MPKRPLVVLRVLVHVSFPAYVMLDELLLLLLLLFLHILGLQHRYYGESMPFSAPDDLLTTAQYKYLTIQQVIEDTAAVLAFVREERNVPAAVPAVVIGGSYGEHFDAYLTAPTSTALAGHADQCCIAMMQHVVCCTVQHCCLPPHRLVYPL